jgi:hypothetical protein
MAPEGRGAASETRRVTLGARGDPAASFFLHVTKTTPTRPLVSTCDFLAIFLSYFGAICLTLGVGLDIMREVRADYARYKAFFLSKIG